MEKTKNALTKGGQWLYKLTRKALAGMTDFLPKLDPIIEVPFVGSTIKDVQDIVYMLNDYYCGEYKKVPAMAIVGSVLIIGYLASPIDLIPDGVPVLGLIDDAFIINIIIELCVDTELKKYRKWRKERPAELAEAKNA